MSFSFSVGTALRALAVVLPALLGLVVLSGCEADSYPQELAYPARTDPLPVGRPEQDSPHIDLPGQFPALFIGLEPPAAREKLLLNPLTLNAQARQKLQDSLVELFGSPAHPKVGGIDDEMRKALRLDEATLAEGSRLYRHQCLHCHGMPGNGQGPTAPWVNPHPRDFRQGRFKFTSTRQDEGERKARREDLVRTLREGIPGASMPAFRLLGDASLEALASYVIHLSLRGEVEYISLVELGQGSASDVTPTGDILQILAGRWMAAQTSPIQPGPYKATTEAEQIASAKRGFDLFTRPGDAGCIACHTDYGRQAPWKYDAWGTMVRPADLTTGVYRGGRRPLDLYYRIDSGINGSGMTAFGKTLSSDQIWDLVNFLQVLPYAKMRKSYGIEIN